VTQCASFLGRTLHPWQHRKELLISCSCQWSPISTRICRQFSTEDVHCPVNAQSQQVWPADCCFNVHSRNDDSQLGSHSIMVVAGCRKGVVTRNLSGDENDSERELSLWRHCTHTWKYKRLRKILSGCQEMANVPNGVETLPKISIAWVECTDVTEKPTDRQTDGRRWHSLTRSSATAKSTARPSRLVGVLYDIYRETNNRSTANQPLVRNWPWNLPNSAK